MRLATAGAASLAAVALVSASLGKPMAANADATVDEVHYTFTGADSVTFDWRGDATDIRYGATDSYGSTATAHAPSPLPFSSAGPFREVELTGLQPGTTYHYSIGGGVDQTFTTSPTSNFRFDAEADVGSTFGWANVGVTQNQIAADNPAFVLMPGDLTYGSPLGPATVDAHFNDVMAWSQRAAYMPAWGNHEWENPSLDDLRNYKGRFALPHPHTSSSAPPGGCCGEDWSWFDAGAVRFIAYPEPYSSRTWDEWKSDADSVFAAAQADPSIRFIVTYGHRPAYSTGAHEGETGLSRVLDDFGDRYSKYVLNINGHSHDYERFQPIHGVTHVTVGGGGSSLEPPWSMTDDRTAFRAMHLAHLRVDVSATGMRLDAVCGPPTVADDLTCVPGAVIDSYSIGNNPPPPPPIAPTLYVDKGKANCTDGGSGSAAQPFCSIKPAASRVVAGQTVLVGPGTYSEQVTVSSSGTASAPIVFAAAPGAHPVVTGSTDGFYISGRSYVTVQGFAVTKTSGDGFVVKNSNNITLRGNDASFAGTPELSKTAKGIRLENSTNSVIATNKAHDNTNYGIYLTGSSNNQVTGNEAYRNAAQYTRLAVGIRVYQSANNVVSSNVTHDNEDSGIEFFNTANDNLVVNNVSYGNGDHGIDNNAVTGQRLIANTIYNNTTAGLNVENASTGASLANNISVDNGTNTTRTRSNVRVDSTSTSGTTLDYDLVYLKTPGPMMIWGSATYTSLASFAANTGKEGHGIEADPRWASPSTADFHLQPGSPAIDSADSGRSGQPASDAAENPRVDDPLTPNAGVGPRRYDDRGALEYVLEEVENAPPNAVLSVTPGSGAAPLRVTADASGSTDTDITPIDRYSFDFGDGTATGPQAGATADHTYAAAGTYTVTVTVSDTVGLASTATTQVTVTPPPDAPPSARLSASPGSGYAPLPVTADASASSDTDDAPIATYRFDFGDGAVTGAQSAATAQHTYAAVGTYTLTVAVTDTAGLSSTASTRVTVAAPLDAPPQADLVLRPPSGPAPLAVTADASHSSDTDATPIASFAFDFGDGSTVAPQAEATASHVYAIAGTYTVTVTVTDTAGLSSRATSQVAVSQDNSPPLAALSVSPASGTAPLRVTADASGSSDGGGAQIASYRFDFGDGTVTDAQASPTAAHTYSDAGTYTVTVTVADDGTPPLTATASKQVTVVSPDLPPSATLDVTPHTGPAPLHVTADATGSSDADGTPIASYTFDFGDGTVKGPASDGTVAHTYTSAGTYTVTVTVADTEGLTSVATTQVTVTALDLPPSATLTATPGAGVGPRAVSLDASGSSDNDATPIATFRFDFGDGSAAVGPQSAAVAAHTYRAAGTYTASVTVTDTAGLTTTATTQVTVFANYVGNPGFETNLNGWNTSGAGAGILLERVASGHSGGWSAKLSNTGTSASTILLNDSPDTVKPAVAASYTATLWARADSGGATLRLRFREYAGTVLAGTATTTATLSTTWQPVTVTYRASAGSSLDLNAYVSSAPAGAAFYVDDVVVYQG